MKDKSVYRLKNGALLQMGFGSGEFFTNANLTDEAAERYLNLKPQGINLFSVYPDDWKSRVEKRFAPKDKSENGSNTKEEKKTKKEA